MPAITAERLRPGAVFVPLDFTCYRAALRHVREIFLRHSDLVKSLSPHEAYLDVIVNKIGPPDGQFVTRLEDVHRFLSPLPVELLPGVGKVMDAKLEALGVRIVGDPHAMDADEIERRFGRYGRRLHQLSNGIDNHPVTPH